MVFPIGMFSVASITLGRVDNLPVVEGSGNCAWIAVAVWDCFHRHAAPYPAGILEEQKLNEGPASCALAGPSPMTNLRHNAGRGAHLLHRAARD